MLNVDLSIRADDGQGVLALGGDFDLADAPAVTSHLIAAIAVCGPSVIVDLAALESIGFAGLGVLLRIRKWSRNSGGDLPLAALRLPVRQALEASGLIDVFSIYRSVDEAARGARQAQHPAPVMPLSVPSQVRPAAVSRSEGRQAAYRRHYRPPARPLHRCDTNRYMELRTLCTRLNNYALSTPQTLAYYLP